MADPRTKEELLKEIENAASENESYQEFKTSLAELNQDIDKLMKPGKEGWKLLDKKTFDPLYTKYLRAAKNLSNFLDETKESTKKEDKALWEVCNAFRHFFATDLTILKKYQNVMNKTPMSMPTIFENARVKTITLNNKNVDVRGGANSARIAMKVSRKNGEEMEGFFTKAVYNDPLADVQGALNKAAAFTNKKDEIAILTKFSEVFHEYCRKKRIRESEETETLHTVMDAVGTLYNGTPIANVPKFLTLYAQMIDKIGTKKASEIMGLPENRVPSDYDLKLMFNKNVQSTFALEFGKVWNVSANMRMAKIAPKARLDTRNVAMTNVAHLLGMDGIVCKARMMKLKDQNGNEVDGIFMEKAKGVDSNNPAPEFSYVKGEMLKNGDRRCLKQLADLQVLDYICGNPDRHGGNMFFDFNEKGELIGVQGIDNDLSFGGLKTTKGNVNFMMTPEHMGVISKGTADKILALDPEEFAYSLYGVLDKEEVEAAKFRLNNMKNEILKSRRKVADYEAKHPGKMDEKGINISYGEKGCIREIEDQDWSRVRMEKLLNPKHDVKNIFQEAKETLDDFEAFSRHPLKGVEYASTETVNRAEKAGITTRLNRTKELYNLMKWTSPDTPESYGAVKDALTKHVELLSNILTRMKDCRKKVRKDTAETGEYFNQYVTKDDLEKIRKSEEAVKSAVTKYYGDRQVEPGKEDKVRGTATTRHEVESVAAVREFVKDVKAITPEEKETLNANHRKAVEAITRAIVKNPDSPAAGPKTVKEQAKATRNANNTNKTKTVKPKTKKGPMKK